MFLVVMLMSDVPAPADPAQVTQLVGRMILFAAAGLAIIALFDALWPDKNKKS